MALRASKRSSPEALGHATGGALHLADHSLGVDDHRHGQLVPLAHLEVVGVVRRRDLHGARPERRIGVAVGDDGNAHAVERQHHLLADQRLKARIVGIHGHGHVAQHRLGARGRHSDAL